jgi:formate dehydrogenase subunit delta
VDIHHLVKMANQIGDFFAPYLDPDEVIKSIAVHLKNSWDPRMRRQIIEYVIADGGTDLSEPVRAAVLSLAPASGKEKPIEDEAPGDD